MPRIFAAHEEHNFNWGAVPFVNGVGALPDASAALPWFAVAAKGYTIDYAKHVLTVMDTLPRATLNGISLYLGVALVPADTKYELIRKIEGAISTKYLGALTVTSPAHGATLHFTVPAVAEALTGTNVHKYKIAAAAPAPLYGDTADDTWKAITLPFATGITSTTGLHITIVECDATSGFVYKSGTHAVACKDS